MAELVPIKAVTLPDLTEGTLAGNGVFDKLMAACKAHLDAEMKKGAIKGPEYSTVYLGQLQAILTTSVQFLFNEQKVALEAQLLEKQIALAEAQAALVGQQLITEVQQEKVLIAQECLLKSQFDNMQATVMKTGAETALLNQKIATEKAQILGLGVDDDSVIGKQKKLYQAQTDGFKRDAEQKVAKLMTDTWNTRRMTDEGTVADDVNKLNDATVGRAVSHMLSGIGA